ncbi:hypothetical protein BKK47_03810 [Rodentibacter mrazii]|uniref:Lipoprotein n=1 Tax=Rodentibacter mrazii TaxID=1908257 RepID=A0A1V3IID3_9PAST|nr:hypothetical protein [Rodentibacter mrazii]OOF40536.1 hypothetical protein BKK47_03810 [Rodentibacter mrazii]
MKKYLLLGLFGLFLMGCSSLPMVQTLPLQQKTERLFKVEQRDVNGKLKQTSLLSLSAQPQAWRWVQSDPLGVPIARVILTNKGWQNDGFVMPNQQAKQLFSAIATALNTKQLFAFSHIERTPQATLYFVDKKQVWRIITRLSGIDIELPDMSYWHIEELN